MPGSKKSNGFMVFTMEWRNRHARYLTVPQAINKAGEYWEQMTEEERSPYKDRAKKEPLICPRKKKERLNCLGVPLSQVERDKEQKKLRKENMCKHIENMVEESIKNNEFVETKYFFIMFNYFTKTDDMVYIPAEVSICEYSVSGGMSIAYSTLINPDVDIFGQLYEATEHAVNTHKLPLPPNALGERDCGLIYMNLVSFIRNSLGHTPDVLPPVFTYKEHMCVVESCLDFLRAKVNPNIENVPILETYSIHYLFYIIKRTTLRMTDGTSDISPYITDAQFEVDYFEYQTEIACEHHEASDNGRYCTKSRVIRWTYIFSDYLCGDLNIKMQPVKHCPPIAKLECITVSGKPNVGGANVNSSAEKKKLEDMPCSTASLNPIRVVAQNAIPTSEPRPRLPVIEDVLHLHNTEEFPSLNAKNQKKGNKKQCNHENDSNALPQNLSSVNAKRDSAPMVNFGRGRARRMRPLVDNKNDFVGVQGRGRGQIHK